MGRYYSGDIEGKFWPAVQCSTVGERFGCMEFRPEVIEYYADQDTLPEINEELKNIEDKMGNQLAKFEEFFNKSCGWNDEKLRTAGLNPSLIEDYADYTFGIKLRDCIIEQGSCSFTAEL
jgi:DNA-directed RNA polymerase subunit L